MGFIKDESSLGLFFKTYEKREILLKNRNGVLAKKKEKRVYTGGAWQKARVVVNHDAIIVQFDDRTVLQWQGELPFAASYVAFGAGTGGSNSRHQVRNVKLSNEVDSPDAPLQVKKSDRPTYEVAYPIERANYWGSELKVLRNWTDAQACARTCDKNPSCVVASYHDRTAGGGYGNTCVLRHAVGPRHPEQSNVHSWVRPTAKN